MASLRKKPPPDVVSSVDPPLEVEAATEASPAPAPEPPPEPVAQPQDDAGAALLAQLELIRQQEAAAQAEQRRTEWVQSSPLAQQHLRGS
jgi:hypothetical protein